jgi:hypothetical protein
MSESPVLTEESVESRPDEPVERRPYRMEVTSESLWVGSLGRCLAKGKTFTVGRRSDALLFHRIGKASILEPDRFHDHELSPEPAQPEPDLYPDDPKLPVKLVRSVLWRSRIHAAGDTLSAPERMVCLWVHHGIAKLEKLVEFSPRGRSYLKILKARAGDQDFTFTPQY